MLPPTLPLGAALPGRTGARVLVLSGLGVEEAREVLAPQPTAVRRASEAVLAKAHWEAVGGRVTLIPRAPRRGGEGYAALTEAERGVAEFFAVAERGPGEGARPL